ncbi:MAG: CvpA family protein [Treponema sp.]|jgi:membrane protein required for colicin V production|nr:CvpA family protein [Treponema sp.]
MEVIDIIFAIFILIIIVRCALRGFVEEVMSMAGLVLGFGAAFFFHKKGAAFLVERYIPDVRILPEVLAFAAIFLIVFLGIKFLEFILKDIITRIHASGADRFLGAVFGFIEGIVLVALVIFVLTIQPLFDAKPLMDKSYFARTLTPFIGEARNSFRFPGGV